MKLFLTTIHESWNLYSEFNTSTLLTLLHNAFNFNAFVIFKCLIISRYCLITLQNPNKWSSLPPRNHRLQWWWYPKCLSYLLSPSILSIKILFSLWNTEVMLIVVLPTTSVICPVFSWILVIMFLVCISDALMTSSKMFKKLHGSAYPQRNPLKIWNFLETPLVAFTQIRVSFGSNWWVKLNSFLRVQFGTTLRGNSHRCSFLLGVLKINEEMEVAICFSCAFSRRVESCSVVDFSRIKQH